MIQLDQRETFFCNGVFIIMHLDHASFLFHTSIGTATLILHAEPC